MYNLIILGGGPAGSAATVYSVRKQLKTAIITNEFGGQSMVSEKIFNWIGTPEIGGMELAENLKKHVLYYKGPYLDVIDGEKIVSITKNDKIITVKSESGKEYTSKAVLVATGSGRRKLEAINADLYEHKGITYCASCDGPLYEGADVLVVGGGNAAFETSAQLLAYCKSVTLINRSDSFRADEIIVQKLLLNPKFKVIKNADITRVDGEQFVSSLTYTDKITNEEHILNSTGIFVEIGQTPNIDFVKDIVKIDENNKIIVDPINQASSTEGIWAAGDCSNGRYHQNNIAVGDAVKAVEDIYIWIQKNK